MIITIWGRAGAGGEKDVPPNDTFDFFILSNAEINILDRSISTTLASLGPYKV